MFIKEYFETLIAHITEHPPDCGDADSILVLLHETYNTVNTMDDDQIKADFNVLYQTMNGMELREVDRIIYPVCKLCRDHERAGFIHGVQIGVRLLQELESDE